MNNIEIKNIKIESIPSIIWGTESEKVFVFIHGKMSKKEYAEQFAVIAQEYGFQTLSFDLPEHGERQNVRNYPCDIFNCMNDAKKIAEYAFSKWKNVSLYGCSLGAQISLQSFSDKLLWPFKKVVFQSPILNMNYLIGKMFEWNGISSELLEKKGEISTSLDVMTWKQFCYYRDNLVMVWPFKTSILFGKKDNLQTMEIMEDFCQRFEADLTVSENSEHPFMAPSDYEIVGKWLHSVIKK